MPPSWGCGMTSLRLPPSSWNIVTWRVRGSRGSTERSPKPALRFERNAYDETLVLCIASDRSAGAGRGHEEFGSGRIRRDSQFRRAGGQSEHLGFAQTVSRRSSILESESARLSAG